MQCSRAWQRMGCSSATLQRRSVASIAVRLVCSSMRWRTQSSDQCTEVRQALPSLLVRISVHHSSTDLSCQTAKRFHFTLLVIGSLNLYRETYGRFGLHRTTRPPTPPHPQMSTVQYTYRSSSTRHPTPRPSAQSKAVPPLHRPSQHPPQPRPRRFKTLSQ
jgi:hypothetical protein